MQLVCARRLFATSCPTFFARTRHSGSFRSFSWQAEHLLPPDCAWTSGEGTAALGGGRASASLGGSLHEARPHAAASRHAIARTTEQSLRQIPTLIGHPCGRARKACARDHPSASTRACADRRRCRPRRGTSRRAAGLRRRDRPRTTPGLATSPGRAGCPSLGARSNPAGGGWSARRGSRRAARDHGSSRTTRGRGTSCRGPRSRLRSRAPRRAPEPFFRWSRSRAPQERDQAAITRGASCPPRGAPPR